MPVGVNEAGRDQLDESGMREVLRYVRNQSRDDWVCIVKCLKAWGHSLELADEWSQQGAENYAGREEVVRV